MFNDTHSTASITCFLHCLFNCVHTKRKKAIQKNKTEIMSTQTTQRHLIIELITKLTAAVGWFCLILSLYEEHDQLLPVYLG